MDLEPRHLNLPLERRQPWGVRLALACGLATAAIALLNVSFSKAFAASSIVIGPVLWLVIFAPHRVFSTTQRGGITRVLVWACFFSYLAIAKAVLVPALLIVMEQALA
jgi:hypothetical protein